MTKHSRKKIFVVFTDFKCFTYHLEMPMGLHATNCKVVNSRSLTANFPLECYDVYGILKASTVFK